MLQLALIFDKIIPLLKNLIIPALLTGAGIIYFYAKGTIPQTSQLTLHHLFYTASFISFLILLYFRKGTAVFFILTMAISYALINYIKITHPRNFQDTPAFINLSFFIPLNLIIFYFWPQKQLLKKQNIYLLLLIFFQYAIGEQFDKYNISLRFNLFSANSNLSFFSWIMFIAAIISFFVRATMTGKIYDYALLFATVNMLFGFYYVANASALTIFYSLSGIIILIATAVYIYNETYKDELTGFSSRTAFMLQSAGFPLKYSVGIIKIDNYDTLRIAFRKSGLNKLMQMIAIKINACETDGLIYRYGDDELVIIYKNEDKNAAYLKMEQIRRAIAGSSFVLSNFKKPIKLTITGCISEKKRSDANALEVLSRTYKTLTETIKFSQNVTSKT